MTSWTSLTLGALLCGAALAQPLAEGLGWHVPAGTTLRRELITTQALVTESMSFREGDASTISQRVFDLVAKTTLRTSDQVQASGAGRPERVRRFYDEARVDAEAEVSAGRQQTRTFKLLGTSPFHGKSVVFTWVPEEDAYGRYFDGLEGREEMLPGLGEDLDGRGLLSADAAGPGSSWSVAPAALRDVLAPGGDLRYEFVDAKDPLIARSLDQGVGANPWLWFGGEAEGEVKVTWARDEEVEGRRLAVLALAVEVTLRRDLTDVVNAERAVNEVVSGQEAERALLTVALKGGGEVRWDLGAGCLYDTQELRVDERLTFVKAMRLPGEDGPRTVEQELVMTGSLRQESRVTVE